jgi:predicted DNA-binding transcriptional regulator YafY
MLHTSGNDYICYLAPSILKPDQIRRRIRILHMTSLPVDTKCFQSVSPATVSRRRLEPKHRSRYRNEETVREVLPRRLVYYRTNWYLDSWCHLRNGLRSSGLDMIRDAAISDIPADASRMKRSMRTSAAARNLHRSASEHGGVALRSPHHTVASPARSGIPGRLSIERTGHLVLCVPYSADYEITMNILRYGADVGADSGACE